MERWLRPTHKSTPYERERPGELVHLDVKKLGRIPDGGGKRFSPGFRENGAGYSPPGKRGVECVHVAVDDHSRYAYDVPRRFLLQQPRVLHAARRRSARHRARTAWHR